MSALFQSIVEIMRSQETDGNVPAEYMFDRELMKKLRTFLLNTDSNDIEAEFFLDRIKITESPTVTIESFLVHHLYDYLYGATR